LGWREAEVVHGVTGSRRDWSGPGMGHGRGRRHRHRHAPSTSVVRRGVEEGNGLGGP